MRHELQLRELPFNSRQLPLQEGAHPDRRLPGKSHWRVVAATWKERALGLLRLSAHPFHVLEHNATFCAQTVSPQGTVQAPCWSYTYSYDLYLATGGTKTFEQTWQLPGNVPKGDQIDIYYNYMGSWHNESWFILQATDNYVLLGDCSYMMDWINVGSIVWVRPGHKLSDAENAAIKEQYKTKLGWDYDGFCYDKHGSDNSGSVCRNPAKSTTETFPARPRIFHHAPPGQEASSDTGATCRA